MPVVISYDHQPVEFIREVERNALGRRYPERLALVDFGENSFFRCGPRIQLVRMEHLFVTCARERTARHATPHPPMSQGDRHA